nr:hypothetical protein [Tanacetum cinerariifolium]
MNSYTFIGLDDVEEGEEISSHKKSFIKRVIEYIKIRRQASRLTRNSITRDRARTHEPLRRHFPVDKVHLCNSSIGIPRECCYGNLWHEFLRKPTVTDIEKLYRHHKEKHGFSGMLGSLDCTDWKWFGCPYAFKGQYVRRDHGSNQFILLEVVALQDLLIWHAFFGVAGSNNDINVLYQSYLFNDFKTGRAPEIPFVANDISYPSGYFLVDGIYLELTPLVKMISQSAHDDHKQILYKKKQESARKDVKRASGVLKKKWDVLANPTRAKKRKNC